MLQLKDNNLRFGGSQDDDTLVPFRHLVEAVEVDGELEGEAGDLVVPEDAEEAVQPGRPGAVVFWAVLTFRRKIKIC